MKKILLFLALMIVTSASAQDVTKFLGIPIDGFKTEMRSKIQAKGFVYNSKLDAFEGEFNGHEVYLSIVTNNNKVYRIALFDKHFCSESDIKIRFNNLCSQFENNRKYESVVKSNQWIPEDEDISYELNVNKKRYEATYSQTPDSTKYDRDLIRTRIIKEHKDVELSDHELEFLVNLDILNLYFENKMNNMVWFMIDEKYGRYRIIMFYDNMYNKANGEDL